VLLESTLYACHVERRPSRRSHHDYPPTRRSSARRQRLRPIPAPISAELDGRRRVADADNEHDAVESPTGGAPGTELSGVHFAVRVERVLPVAAVVVDYYPPVGNGSGPTDAELMLTPVQYESDGSELDHDIQPSYSDVKLQLFYSSNTQAYGLEHAVARGPPDDLARRCELQRRRR